MSSTAHDARVGSAAFDADSVAYAQRLIGRLRNADGDTAVEVDDDVLVRLHQEHAP
jgi:hypothetical protein